MPVISYIVGSQSGIFPHLRCLKSKCLTSLIQQIICDGTQAHLPVQPFFSYKSTLHQPDETRVHVDFSLHVVDKPSLNLGIWRCRVSFWLKGQTDTSEPVSALSYYIEGFRLAHSEAEKFVEAKYGLKQILAPQTDGQLTDRYQLLEATRAARNESGVVKRVARKE